MHFTCKVGGIKVSGSASLKSSPTLLMEICHVTEVKSVQLVPIGELGNKKERDFIFYTFFGHSFGVIALISKKLSPH